MKLLYLAIAYMAGIFLGRFAWDLGYADCLSPSWPWVIFLFLIPLPFLLDASKKLSKRSTCWPTWANFSPPQTSRTYTLQIALLFTLLTGVFRYISHPITPCWDVGDLAFYNLPADDAYNNSAPLATVKAM